MEETKPEKIKDANLDLCVCASQSDGLSRGTHTFLGSYHEPSELRSTNTKIEVGIFGFLRLNFNTRKNKYNMYKSFVFNI